MSLIRSLSRVRPGRLLSLTGLVLTRPLFALPTLEATRRCMAICDERFGKKHRLNGPANAFRHALWNVLIALHCSRWSSKLEDLLDWTKRITDWHEDTFPNPASDRAMDLHNNRVGRELFRSQPGLDAHAYVELILVLKEQAVQLTGSTIPEHCAETLVYIEKAPD